MAVKKTPKKTSIKKVAKKKVVKVSSSANTASPAVGTLDGHLDEVIVTGSRRKLTNYRKADRGEFRGDFTRDTFDSENRFSRVLLQQGRVQLDADWNEQTSINLHHLRNLACDIGSEHWGPNEGAGFDIDAEDKDSIGFFITPGHYYVNGILCEAGLDDKGKFISYMNQPDYSVPFEEQPSQLKSAISSGEKAALVYLDVWERHYTYIDDDSIRELALGGPDTATRAKVIWQIKVALIPMENAIWNGDGIHPFKEHYQKFLEEISSIKKPGTGSLCAKVKDKSGDDNDPCLVAPESRYRGTENQLYRVEIHRSGVAKDRAHNEKQPVATFKWSRENSSVIFPIIDIQGNSISLEHLGKDCRYGLKKYDWVELIDNDSVLLSRADNLFQVEDVDKENRQVILSNPSDTNIEIEASKHVYLRRWDHADGDANGIAVVENRDGEMWLDIEDGIQVQFKASTVDSRGDMIDEVNHKNSTYYQAGDYWLIPARMITGNIEWPLDDERKPKCMPAHGVVHHYAPLAVFEEDPNGSDVNAKLRRILTQAWE